tara:strand:+ start:3604 stop:3789 length:186 start_codon:yes stop_codon:yes gene_type:complete
MKKFLIELEAESKDTVEDMFRLWENKNPNLDKLRCHSIKEGQQLKEKVSKEFQTIKEILTR